MEKQCEVEFERKVLLGRVDYTGSGHKNNKVYLEVALRETDRGFEFSASASVWNHLGTDCYVCGQMLDDIADGGPFVGVRTATFKKVYRWWQRYHLNGTNAGTPLQAATIDRWNDEHGKAYDYEWACEILRAHELYEVPHPETGEPYKYGHGWLYEEIPGGILAEMKRFIGWPVTPGETRVTSMPSVLCVGGGRVFSQPAWVFQVAGL